MSAVLAHPGRPVRANGTRSAAGVPPISFWRRDECGTGPGACYRATMTTAEVISIGATTVALISSAAAWRAIITSRRISADTIRAQINIAARNSRATVVSANRQKWIDAIREDIADFISTRSRIVALTSTGSFQGAGQDALLTEERELRAKLVMLQARIEMRLNHTEDDHLALLEALDQYDREASDEVETTLRAAGRKIFADEWRRLKKEASGIDPVVKEAVPPRRV